MKYLSLVLLIAGIALILWGLIGFWAASIPEEGVDTAFYWWSGLWEVLLGASLILLRFPLKRFASSG